MLSSQSLFRCGLVVIMIAMVHAGSSKSSKIGKGGSSGGRWSGGGRWNNNKKPDRWSSPDNSWRRDDDNDYDDDFPDINRMPFCTLANPVQEQYDLIIRSWRLAYLASNANAAAITTFDRQTAWHANMMMEKFMTVVEEYEGDGKTTTLRLFLLFTSHA
jgi:hypothetical protein